MENNTDQKTLTKQQDFADNKAKKKKNCKVKKRKIQKQLPQYYRNLSKDKKKKKRKKLVRLEERRREEQTKNYYYERKNLMN